MDTNVVSELISTVGFPITCVIALAYGCFLQGGTKREPLPKTTFANASPGWSAHIDDFTDTTFSLHFGTGIGTATKIFVVIEHTKTND